MPVRIQPERPRHGCAPPVAVAAGALLLLACSVSLGEPAGTETRGDFLVKSWHTEDGLPDGNVTAIEQTPVGGIAWSMARARLRRRLAVVERQRALEPERSRIARDMHDELGAGRTQISLLTALADGRAENAAEVRAQSGKIAGVARNLVQSLDEIVWAVR